jgi:hypothetical protein
MPCDGWERYGFVFRASGVAIKVAVVAIGEAGIDEVRAVLRGCKHLIGA